jgi:hypothetical protein
VPDVEVRVGQAVDETGNRRPLADVAEDEAGKPPDLRIRVAEEGDHRRPRPSAEGLIDLHGGVPENGPVVVPEGLLENREDKAVRPVPENPEDDLLAAPAVLIDA